MKLFALLSVVGFALVATATGSGSGSGSGKNNQLKWRPGTEYHFDYEGRLLTGLPELNTQFSGLGLKCKIEVTVSQQNKLGLKITDAKYVRVNDQLHGDGTAINANWRKIKLPSYEEVPAESRRWMESPIRFEFSSTGVFEQMTVNGDEPEWSVNFKKALVSILHIRFEEDSLSGGLLENRIESESSSSDDDFVDYWKTKEESLDGICDVTYQINRLPAYMIRELPEKVPFHQACPKDSKYYGIVKTRDVSSCSKRSSFVYYKPGFFRCATGNCEGMWSRSSITRYVTCGTRGDLRIQSIVNEGELSQNLFGFKAEKFLTGSRQSLSLVKEVSSAKTPENPSNPIAVKNLYYEYDLKRQNTDGLPLVNSANLGEANLVHKNGGGGRGGRDMEEEEKWQQSKLIPQVKKLLKEIVNEDLFNHENIGEKQVNMKALGLARAFTVLNRTAISSIYNELKTEFSSEEKKHMFKNVFFDTLLMGGSVSNVMFVKEQIEAGELSNTQIVSMFTFLPQYVLTPNRNLLKSLYELVTSRHITEQPLLYNHAIMSFTTLLQKACIADNRETSYPTNVYGDFCNPESDIVVNTWIPYLQRELNQANGVEKRNLIIVTLGLMSHKNIIPALVPFVENTHRVRESGGDGASKLSRYLAVYSLGVVGRKFPGLVIPMVYSVFSNPAEQTEVRIAAFNVILRSEPSMTVFHKIAASTWREQNKEVLKVVNTALFSLSQQADLASMEITGSSLPRKAWLVYPLIKKTGGRFPTSAAVHTSEYLKTLGVGYRDVTAWVSGDQNSIIPSDIFHRIVYYMDRYQFSPLEIGLRVRNGENLVEQILELVDPGQGRQSREEFSERINERLHDEWRNVIENLRIKNRESGDAAEAALFVNLFEDSPMFYSFKSSSAEALREKVRHLLKNPTALRNLANGEDTHLNFQRIFDLAPSEFSIPSDMGFPILIEVHLPVTVSLRGKLSVDKTNRLIPSFKTEFKAIFASQMTGWVGTMIPFTNEFALTGVEKHTVLNLPIQFDLDFNVREHKMNLKMKALTASRPVNLLTFQVRPFTVHQQIWNLEPITLSHNFKVISSRSPKKTLVYPYGEYIGLDLKAVITSESYFLDFRTVVQKLKMVNYNPMNLLRFGWTNGALSEAGLPSFRKHHFVVKYDPSASTTKEIEFQVEYGYGSKLKGEESTKIHQLEVEERESEREGLLPYKVARKALRELSERAERNEKVNELLEGIQVEYGRAITVKYAVLLKGGSRHRALSFRLNFANGFQEHKEKWDLHLETEGSKQICVNGFMNWPKNTLWKMEEVRRNDFEFRYQNVIGFGQKCEEHKIKTEGTTKVSNRQKDMSRESEEGKLYERLIERGVPAAELAEVSDKVRRQASQLDEVDFVVKYENVPKKYMVYSEYFVQYLKAIWWSNLSPYEPSTKEAVNPNGGGEFTGTSDYKIRFHPQSGTFNLTIKRFHETINFEHVPVPYPFTYIFPMTPFTASGSGLFGVLVKAATGRDLHPKCKVEDRWIKTYDNTTNQLQIDECFHLLSGDCSSRKSFAVMIRKTNKRDEASKELKIYLNGKIDIHLKPSDRHSKSSNEVKVIVNGNEVRVSKSHPYVIKDKKDKFVAEVKESQDGVIILKSRWVDVKFNGEKAVIEASVQLKNKLCGLCGDLSNQRQRGPGDCQYSRPELYAASYRTPLNSRPCESLPRQVEEDLERETRECNKFEEIPTKIRNAFESQVGKCTIHRHEILERQEKVCFSRLPITECSARCRPDGSGGSAMVEKRVGFACMAKNRVSEHIIEKIRQGKVLKELENLPKDFSVTMSLPRHCVPV